MKNMKIIKVLHYLNLILLVTVTANVTAQEFVIDDIRVEGLQRMTPGTIFNYLPVEIGDTFNDEISTESVRALFGTGFFDDVRLERDGDVLVVIVKERPAIGSIDISGNDDIKTEDLMKGLDEIGFSLGQVFNQSQLDQLERELRRQYTSRGKYGVKIESTVTPLGNNRVGVRVDISEGKAARIKQINIVGNHAFKEGGLLDLFELTGPTLISFLTKTDQYSREKFAGDLEKLASHYRDNGYINFDIDSTQVELTPDRKEIYITINITEGVQYMVSGIKLAGEFILPEEELFLYIVARQNNLFSLKSVTDSTKFLTDRLGHEGYAFANVNFIPDINEEDKTVAITFFVDPGQRVYVRRITFMGNNKTRDEVLRREMRQQEGAWISTPMVERGKERLQRLGYFEEVNVETPAVAGATDLVDVNYTVEEKAFGEFTAGLGYGQIQGLIIQTSIAQDNFLGSGKRIQFAFITAFDNRIYGGGFMFGIPISENNTIFAGLNYENTNLSEDGFYAYEVQDFINREGDQFDVLRLTAAFAYDTRDDATFPNRGSQHRLSSEISVPSFGNPLEFYKITYKGQYFRPAFWKFVFSLKGEVGYGDSYGDTDILPFFENFYAGGPRTVRGFEENTLGPKDSFGNPLGGYMKLVGGSELLFPVPFIKKAADSVRLSMFFDAGNVYGYTSRINPSDPFGSLIYTKQDIDLSKLRYSIGIGGTWISPFGVVSASWAKPFNTQPFDQIQMFQFNFGTSF
ncbi:MAG: outer rane protein assembly factor BamA [Gammaproteobacteria bacterium]|nr:outer rane protein assembly factor BamA [Gammaproteobacteria bacterium]